MVRIGIADSGVRPAELKRAKVTDWIDLSADRSAVPVDPVGHGTHVAQIVEQTIAAIAPGEPIEIAFAKVFPANGGASFEDIRRGADWLGERRVSAANFSLGADVPSETGAVLAFGDPPAGVKLELAEAFRRLHGRGVVPVVAGGNGARNYGLAPHASFATTVSDLPWVLSVGWPMFTTGLNTDVVESSDSGSSFSAPQAAAKAALVNARAASSDLTMEALMVTAEPRGPSEPEIIRGSPEVVPEVACAFLGRDLVRRPRLGALDPLVAAAWETARGAEREICAALTKPGYSCEIPGRCGWGYLRYGAALEYVKDRRAPEWFHAGNVPGLAKDARWASWAPGYAIRLRHSAYRAGAEASTFALTAAEGAIESATPLGATGLSLATGTARAIVRTPAGEAHVAGFGPVGRPAASAAGLRLDTEGTVLGAWLPNGRWVAVTRGRPARATIVWNRQEAAASK